MAKLDKSQVNANIKFEDWELFAKKLAHQFRRSIYKWGHSITFEDAYSEVTLRWVLARDGFKPELGFSFGTYFARAVHYWVRPFVQSMREDRESNNAVRLDLSVVDEGDSSFHEIIVDRGQHTPEQDLIRREGLEIGQDIPPLVRHLLKLMIEAPEELLCELRAAEAQREWALSIGSSCHQQSAPTQLTPKVLAQIFGFNWKQRLRLRQELEEASHNVG